MLLLVSFLWVIRLNVIFPSMVREYALNTIINDLDPPNIRYSNIQRQYYKPNMFLDVTYEHFKHKLIKSENKTIIIEDNNIYLKYPDDERYFRYIVRVTVNKGFPLCECCWYNPVSNKNEQFGWVIIEGIPRLIWVDLHARMFGSILYASA